MSRCGVLLSFSARLFISMARIVEVYQEENGSSFTHNGVEYDLNKLYRLTDKVHKVFYPVSRLEWILDFDEPDEERLKKKDSGLPLLITYSDGQWVTLDGLHRLTKAVRKGSKMVKVQVVLPNVLAQCKK